LWELFRDIAAAARVAFDVQHIPGHTSEADVLAGKITAADRSGNAQADLWARSGASQHPSFGDARSFPAHLADTANRQVVLAQIIDARHALLRTLGKVDPDDDSGDPVANAPLEPVPEVPTTVEELQARWPRFPWNPPSDPVSFGLGDAPLSLRAAAKVSHKKAWGFGVPMARALRWYFDGLMWQEDHPCSFFELMVDFLASTHTPLTHQARPQDKPLTVKDLLSMFTAAVRALPNIAGGMPVHPAKICKSSHLTIFGLQKQANCLTHRPQFRCPDQVHQVFLHCLVALNPHGKWEWDLPEFTNEPLWTDPDGGGPQQTFGNLARIQAGLAPSHKTAAVDSAREARILAHNELGHGHTVQTWAPQAPVMDAKAFASWWKCSVQVRCAACGSQKPLRLLDAFLEDPCPSAGAPQ
jgi:hypothetical protein